MRSAEPKPGGGHSLKSSVLHSSYFSHHTSPFIAASSSVNKVRPGAPRQWDQSETCFSLKSFQARCYDTAGALRIQQKIVAGGHGWQGAGKEPRLLCLETGLLFLFLAWFFLLNFIPPKSGKSKHYTQLLAPSSGGPGSFSETMTSPSPCANNRTSSLEAKFCG